jgi:glycosyltransferase involved in cell wall biosynthesis
MHICIVSQNHLCRNPRVLKEAILWIQNGYKVSIGTFWYNNELLELDKKLLEESGLHDKITYQSYTDIRENKLQNAYIRTEFQLARIIKKWIGLETFQLSGYGSTRVIPWILKQNADIVSCHQEIACLITPKLKKLKIPFFVDFEDWYSKDLLPEDQKLRPIKMLQKAESFALNHAIFTLTPSKAMSEAIHATYGGKRPHTIYNSFSQTLRNAIDNNLNVTKYDIKLKLSWVSQWIGHGRGLDKMIAYLQQLEMEVEIHLAGNIRNNYDTYLQKIASEKGNIKLIFHPILHPSLIVSWLSQFDAGIASEPITSYSTDLTVSNKLFYYLLAGIPVIAFHTLGQAEIAKSAPNAIIICDKNPNSLQIITSWKKNDEVFRKAKEESYATGTKFSWENQSNDYLNLIRSYYQKSKQS